jgi:5-methylcytosine-specific restriction protein A
MICLGAPIRGVSLAAPVMRLPTEMEAGSQERARLYKSARWRATRDAFLRHHPVCGCGQPAVVADHRDGHQHLDWRKHFWDQSTMQSLCRNCHARKSQGEGEAWRKAGGGMG